jgi:hypothetical protein
MRRLQEAVIETEHSFEPKSDGLLGEINQSRKARLFCGGGAISMSTMGTLEIT